MRLESLTNYETVPEFLSGGGEMGQRIREFDWANTPLGPPQNWPQSLKTCIRIMLTSRQPIWIGWGKELIKFYNDPYKDIVRGKHPWALGTPASVVWKDIWKDIEPMLQQVMEKNQGTYVESQLLIMERNGYPEETYYTFSYTPIPGDQGGTEGMFCANTDDTDRIISERQLRTLTQLGKVLIDSNSFGEVIEDTINTLAENPYDFPVALFRRIENDKAILVYSSHLGEAASNASRDIDLASEDEISTVVNKAISTRKLQLFEGVRHKIGQLHAGAWPIAPDKLIVIPVMQPSMKQPYGILIVGLNPYRVFDEKYSGFFSLVADQMSTSFTHVNVLEEERKRASALAEIDKAKTIFFTNISHEFRTPLTLMLGSLEEMLNRSVKNASDQKIIETAHRNAMRLLRLVNNLLDFSRLEAGRTKAQFQPTSIAAFTRDIASNFRAVAEAAGLEFNIITDSVVQPVYVDKEMWEKIVLNLLSNAFKYTLKGSINVSLSTNRNMVELRVKDTGVGIPEKDLPNMFQRFHRVENITGRSFEGTGIGLSLVKELVQLHGGKISVRSKQGEGSEFIVAIPTGRDHLPAEHVVEKELDIDTSISDAFIEEASSLIEQQSADDAGSDGKNLPAVLVVDDNMDMRNYIKSILQKQFNVSTASNGKEALQKIKARNPELVVSDIMMPIMDGIELLRSIKENPQTQTLPVILVSARAGEESRIEGYEIGADDYLSKPFSSKELIARVGAQILLSKKRKSVENHLHNLFVQAPTAIQILKGPDFIYELANERSLQIIGKTKEEVLGQKLLDVNPAAKDQSFMKVLHEVYETGERFVAEELPFYYFNNGKKIESYVKVVFQPMKDENGAVTGIMITGDDITPQVLGRKRIEESERQFKNVLIQSPSIFLILKGAEMMITFANDPLFVSWGKGTDIIGKPLLEVLPELTDQPFPKLLKKVLDTGETINGMEEKAVLLVNGQPIDKYYNFVYQPIFDGDNVISGITVMATDVTDQVVARMKIEESEMRFRTLAESLPQLVWIRNTNGLIEYVSRNWEEYSGIQDAERAWEEMVHADDSIAINHAWQQAMTTGSSFRHEVRLRNKNGEFRWHYSVGEPVIDESGIVIKWIGALTDVHEQKTFAERLEKLVTERTEELQNKNKELENSESFLLQLIDSSVEYISVLDRNLNYITVNSKFESIINITRQQIRGMNVLELNPKVAGTVQYESMKKALGGETIYLDKRPSIARPDLYIDTYFVPLRIQNKVQGIMIMARDVTEIVRTEKLLEQKNQELSRSNEDLQQFAHVASHDLKEPVRKVRTFANRLGHELGESLSPNARTFLTKMEKAAERMSTMIDGVLQYSSLTALPAEVQSVNLNEIIKDILLDLEVSLSEKHAIVNTQPLPTIEGSSILLYQLFYNLIFNSLKFAKAGIPPDIRITSENISSAGNGTNVIEDNVLIKINDNGIGFSDADAKRIFKPFSRLNSKDKYEGTGLGLALCKKIVERHGGTIEARGVEGMGSTFLIILPKNMRRNFELNTVE